MDLMIYLREEAVVTCALCGTFCGCVLHFHLDYVLELCERGKRLPSPDPAHAIEVYEVSNSIHQCAKEVKLAVEPLLRWTSI